MVSESSEYRKGGEGAELAGISDGETRSSNEASESDAPSLGKGDTPAGGEQPAGTGQWLDARELNVLSVLAPDATSQQFFTPFRLA